MPNSGNGRTVLIVDDEATVAESLTAVFRLHGYETRNAYSAEQAIETMAAWRPDLAVLDVMLPAMNGIELGIVVRENYPECQVLLFSGSQSTAALLQEAAGKGHRFEILAKPVHPADLLEMVGALLGDHPRRSRAPRRLN